MYGHFSVEAGTTNGGINIRNSIAPARSTVRLDAHTTNSPMDVRMHEAYEGSFSLRTTNKTPTISYRSHPKDPEGQDRKRKVVSNKVEGSALSGNVFWGDEGRDRGEVKMETTNSETILRV